MYVIVLCDLLFFVTWGLSVIDVSSDPYLDCLRYIKCGLNHVVSIGFWIAGILLGPIDIL